ncbi:MAG: FAD-binding oxidoreductase [Candidatus Caldarchaeum sp.]|nr:FAD-binding oxidoreductase [Candidatus Caldarchaeum sp.]
MSSVERLVGSVSVKALMGDEVLRRYRSDGLREFRGFRREYAVSRVAVVFPKDTSEVVEVVKAANRYRVPLVPAGGLTGLMGGAMPITDCVVVDMREMNRVLRVSREDRVVECEAGITLEELDRAAQSAGLTIGHDPWTKKYATVGGCIATNGMGYTAAAYGSMRRQVLGLEVVLPTGEVLRTRSVEDFSTGPSLAQLFVGSEGTLGIITKASLRVHTIPEERRLLGYRFESFEEGFPTVVKIFSSGLNPSMMEYGEVFESPSDPSGMYESELFIMFEGPRRVVEAKVETAEELCRAAKLENSRVEEFWSHRHDVADFYVENVAKSNSHPVWGDAFFDFIHVSLPVSKVLEYKRQTSEVLKRHGLWVLDRGVWNSPEYFSIAFLKPSGTGQPDSLKHLSQAFDEMVYLAHRMGGSMEYCHGVGLKLAKYMEGEHGAAGLEILRRIKRALDPNNIMNPGKLIHGVEGKI